MMMDYFNNKPFFKIRFHIDFFKFSPIQVRYIFHSNINFVLRNQKGTPQYKSYFLSFLPSISPFHAIAPDQCGKCRDRKVHQFHHFMLLHPLSINTNFALCLYQKSNQTDQQHFMS